MEERARDLEICGTLLLAREGINGTISGHERNLRTFLAFLKSDPRVEDLVHKESWSDEKPFLRLKVRLKKEIVTMGMPEVDPTEVVGTYVKPADWNAPTLSQTWSWWIHEMIMKSRLARLRA